MAGGLNFSGLNPFQVQAPSPMQIGASAQDYLGAQRVGQEAINGVKSVADMLMSARQRQEELALKDKALVQDNDQFQQKMAQDTSQFDRNMAIKEAELDMSRQQQELNRTKTALDVKVTEKELERQAIKDARQEELRKNAPNITKLFEDPEYQKTEEGQKLATLLYANDPDRYLQHKKELYSFGKDVSKDRFVKTAFAEFAKPENKQIFEKLNSGEPEGFKEFGSLLNRMYAKGQIDGDTYLDLQQKMLQLPAQIYTSMTSRIRAERAASSQSQNTTQNYTTDAQGNSVPIDPVTAGSLKMQGKPVYGIDTRGNVKGSAPKKDKFSAALKALGVEGGT